MASNVIDRDLGLRNILLQLQQARSVEVVVGILEGSQNKDATIAEYAAANEYGTKNIPERSFMRSSFDESLGNIQRDMNNEAGKVMRGERDIRSALGVVGMKHQARVKRKIGSNIQPANHPETIARKKSSKTLIDTGAMLNSVQYLVRGRT